MKYLNILVIVSLVLIGAICYLVQAHISASNYPAWHTALGNIGSAVLICGLLTLFQNIITKHLEDANLRKLLKISTSVHDSRLMDILIDSSKYNYTDIIVKSISFAAIMNDGQRWVGNNSPALEQRFSRANTTTEFFLVNPDSPFCQSLANKTQTTLESQKNKILTAIGLIESTYNRSKKKGDLKIYYLKNYPTQTLFFSDESVVVTPYQVSSGRTKIPLYEYACEEGHNTIASYLFEDLGRVRDESKLISVNGQHLTERQAAETQTPEKKKSFWSKMCFWRR